MDVPGYFAERTPLVDARLDELLPPADAPPGELHAAMRHLIFPGGKRLRPALAFSAAEALGVAPEVALPAAAAVELIHTYSLVHDDLPCMDDDVERRGRPTVHVAFGEATAVLAGDALQALAFEALAAPEVTAEAVAAGVRELAATSGAAYLVGGQVDDLDFGRGNSESDDVYSRRIESVHERKSAALIAASITGGARLAGASEGRLASLRASGFEVGIAFQIADDWLDRDDPDDACSLVRAVGADAALERAEVLLGQALTRLDDLGEAAEPLRELMRFAVRRDS
ncbi:MAG: polyprenyl synthetase family protein [Myxococcota bacterium]|nr:polyprenyl synthetase family protein [Myxococcota bacterium]